MKISSNEGNSVPTAHITVNKNRVKIYDNNNYYLQNGQTFEVELYNPTYVKVKAVIELDGQNVTAGGVIIKPGERLYLERFIDSNNKFLYETYDVDDSAQTQKAISKNGKVVIKFYGEEFFVNLGSYTSNNFYYNKPSPSTFTPQTYFNTTNNTTNSGTFTLTSNTLGWDNGRVGMDMFDTLYSDTSNKTELSETGRVEKGEASSQEFVLSNDKFSNYVLETVNYTISPVSKKPITKENLTSVRCYCHSCGAKTKTNHKFCSSCGEKL